MEFKALRAPTLTSEVAHKLEGLLSTRPGVEQFTITLESSEINIFFDENRLDFRSLTYMLAQAGCPLQSIEVALLKPAPSPP